jgi:hypothetical protein
MNRPSDSSRPRIGCVPGRVLQMTVPTTMIRSNHQWRREIQIDTVQEEMVTSHLTINTLNYYEMILP